MSPRPGLAKVRSIPHVSRTTKSFVRTLEGALRSWLELGDVISEGAATSQKGKPDRPTYFGSTSILLAWNRAPDDKLRDPAAYGALDGDPHLRLRALRIARREAEARAGQDLLQVRADISTRRTEHGFLITIDVEAELATKALMSRR